MIVRELVTMLGFKTDNAGLKTFEEGVNSAKMSVIALTAAITSAVTAMFLFVESAAKVGDRLDKLKDIIGFTIKDYQGLEGAANLAGISNEEFAKSLTLFGRAVGMARQGMSQYIKEFAILGVNIRDSNGKVKSQKELFLEAAEGIKNLKTSADRAAVSQLMFGRSGTKLINFFRRGKDGIQAAVKEYLKYAFVLDKKATAQSVRFTDTQFLLHTAIKGLKNEIGIGLMPVMQKMIDQTLKWFAANRKVIVSGLIKFFKAMLVLAKGLGKAMKFLVSVVKNTIGVWNDLNRAFGSTVKILTLLFALGLIAKLKMIRNIVAGGLGLIEFILSPIGLISAAIVGLILILDDLAVYMTGGKSLTGELMKKFPKLHDFLKGVFFIIKAMVVTIQDVGKVVMPIFSAIGKVIDFAMIKPLKFVFSLMKSIINFFLKMRSFALSKLGSYIGHGLSAVGFGSHAEPLFQGGNASSGSLNFAKMPAMGVPALAGAGGAASNRNVHVNTAINLTVPPGTPETQQNFLQQTARQTFEPIFSRKLREALSVFPGVEQ